MKKIFTILLAVILLSVGAKAQDSTKMVAATKNDVTATKVATNQKSGQANDILTNFSQLAIKNIFGSKKEVDYSSTIFGLLHSVKKQYDDDKLYKNTRWTRDVELNALGRIDSTNHISGFGGGLKFYLVNKRDITLDDEGLNATMSSYETRLNAEIKKATVDFVYYLKSVNPKDSANIKKMPAPYSASFDKFYKSHDYHDLDPLVISVLKKNGSKIVEGKGLADSANQYFTDKINQIKERPLWTLSGNYYHAVNNTTDTATFESKFLVGISDSKNPHFWEYNASSSLKLFNNTLNKNVSAQKFHFETGINKILSDGNDGASNMEVKFFGSYDKSFNTIDVASAVTANLTVRYRVTQLGGFWIPVTLSYDPGKGKLFGFFDFTLNIDPVSK